MAAGQCLPDDHQNQGGAPGGTRIDPPIVQQAAHGQRKPRSPPTYIAMPWDNTCPDHRHSGFTLVEMMVAMLVLLVGVLGTIKLLDTSLAVGQTTRSREAATNLTREIVESARSIDYDLLLTASAPAALQALNGLADADSAAGWQIKRRGVSYTVTVTACIYDDPKDGSFVGAATGAGYCSNSAGSGDSNGDDYRKITVTAAWGSRQVKLNADVVNPAGGFGPRITAWPPAVTFPSVNADSIIPVTAVTTIEVRMTVQTSPARSLNWDAGDTKHGDQLTSASAASSWPVVWNLGTPVAADTYTCATTVDWVPDAPAYQMTVQPFDFSGTPGDLRTQLVSIDRSTPYRLCDFEGGRNPQHGGVIDLQWRASFEGDVVSYSVWRKQPGSGTKDLICDAVRSTQCTDPSPPPGGGAIEYEVKPKQDNIGGLKFGPATSLTIPAVVTANVAPTAPGSVQVVNGSQPTISWTSSSDSDGSVIFYRVYRDGMAIADRYGTTSNGFIDKSAGGTSHTYYVSAVDNSFAESTLVQASL